MFKIILISISTLFSINALAFNKHPDQKCADFPRINGYELGLENKCLGLALTQEDVPWGKPRRIVFKDENTIIVSDMGSFAVEKRDIGALWQVNIKTKEYKKLYSGGNWTHGLAIDSKERILFGDSDKIYRINEVGEIKVIIDNLPVDGTHPLSHFILLKNDDLILNIGASSNDCKDELKNSTTCDQRDLTGHLRLYKINEDSSYSVEVYNFINNLDTNRDIIPTTFFARGLRNSMALVYNPTLNEIYQVENNIDAPGTHEELNTISFDQELMYDYGWPFCKENNKQTGVGRGRFKGFCKNTAISSTFLIPAHSAPLDMMYYNGKEHPELRNTLLMTWHGWRRDFDQGLVSYYTDQNGAPILNKIDQGSVFKKSQPFESLIAGSSFNDSQPKFTPVGMASDVDGKIWIVDDKNNAIVVYASSTEAPDQIIDEKEEERLNNINEYISNMSEIQITSFDQVYTALLSTKKCMDCHSSKDIPSDSISGLKTFLTNNWLSLDQPLLKSTLLNRLSTQSGKPMPPFPDQPFEEEFESIYNDLITWVKNNLK